MRFVVFGLTISSSWGNGHATLWRGLCRALGAMGHHVVFFERDVPYYAAHRDATAPQGCDLRLYGSWPSARIDARRETGRADVAVVTSYCPDADPAAELVLEGCPGPRVFYDLDTPVTLDALERGERAAYLPAAGLGDFDLVLSFTGGRALRALCDRLGARRVAPLYGCVDPLVHLPVAPQPRFAADLSYLGTYSSDRRAGIEELFVAPARRAAERRFLLAGAMYPDDFPWQQNLYFVPHVPPGEHPAFFSSTRVSLNVTRGAMARWGWCPSGRLFEAAACGAPQITDSWEGLDSFLSPGTEILVAHDADDVLAALSRPEQELSRIAQAARARVLEEHTALARARELVNRIEEV